MRIASHEHSGRATWGLVTPDGLIPGTSLLDGRFDSVLALLDAGALTELERAVLPPERIALEAVKWLPVVGAPRNIFCIGHNYEAHRLETRRDPNSHPTVFMRNAASQTGHLAPLLRPRESRMLDFEGEIAVVIGRPGRRIAPQEAWAHVAGYAPYNDGSVRDWQRHSTQWGPGKNFEGTGAFGPWMTTRGEIADGEELTLETRVNGETVQSATTEQLIYPIPTLIAYLSTFTTLFPGDVIVTGTPGGVGVARTPPHFLEPGDQVEVSISRLGVLVNTVGDEA